ncbi:MAG TPA: HpcH/HpaI aldolase/citrate lyase family protein [Casimicrobiaceae bacterium]|nr:HpcH/HpaI aldolase/citrate lyase family protein [Casimicrobiaceae bacterium]
MDLPRNGFKRAIASGTPVGTWLGSGAPVTAEALGCAGFDFLVVDTEHTPLDPAGLVEVLRAVAATPAQAVVRPAWNDMVLIKRILDAGATTLLIPWVQNADEARRAVSYTRYPPEGVRGVASSHRGARYGLVPNYLQRAAEEICIIVQIETLAAVSHLEEIAAVPGVDSIFIGPNDLAASMGHLGNMPHPQVQEQMQRIAQTCRNLGKPCGTLAGTPEICARYLEYGYSWVAVGADIVFMLQRATDVLDHVRACVSGRQASA